MSALVLVVANFISQPTDELSRRRYRKFLWLVALISVNAFLVNLFLADYPPESNKVFDILWKGCLSSALLLLCIRNQKDLELFLFAIVVGCGFVGYEVVLAGQGSIERGRLEGFMFPGAQGSNAGAAVLSMGLVLAGYFVITWQNKLYAIASLIISPLILETILRCNSRGAYLGLMASGIVILTLSRGSSRKRAMLLCAIGVGAILLMAKNVGIWERFASIFVDAEQRDGSASERLLYWKAALKMIMDFPFGSGGEAAFTSPRGVSYIAHFRPEFRSVHNGPLDIAAGWGLQGFALLFTVLCGAAIASYRAAMIDRHDNPKRSLLGTTLLATIAGQLVCCMFTSVLDGEWFLWLAVSCIAYAHTVENEQFERDEDDSINLESPLE